MSFSCVLIGQESLLVGCGEALLEAGHEIRAVISPDPEIRAWARGKTIPQSERIADLAEQFAPGGFDWLLSIANLAVIPAEVLSLPANGAVNFHDGPLPDYAGLNTPVWALLAGEGWHGVTWHVIEGGIDEGDILAQETVEIAGDETAFSLNSKCYAAAMDSFPEVMAQLENGLERQAQDLSHRRYFARDDRPEGFARLDLHRPAEALARQVRALDFGGYWNPLACAKLETSEGILRIGGAEPAGRSGALPGTVIEVAGNALVVATGDGDLRLTGLTDLMGGQAEMPAKGSRLPGIEATELEALSALQQRVAKREPLWRRALQAHHALPVPLARKGEAGGWSAQRVSVPYGLDEAGLRAAALVWALRGSGEEHGDVAVSTPALQADAATGYVAPWVPVPVGIESTLADLAEAVATAAGRDAGFALDLIARDPAITAAGTPPVALALDGAGPVEGSV
ncbi:formyltransferase family protein, partial [Cribrihabitans sp. XS_ASV171]